MGWTIVFHPEFDAEFDEFAAEVQEELLAEATFVEMFGPSAGRPHVDTLKGSSHANMKELRFEAADGEWRVAFAFDPTRRAIMLVAGDKTGGSEKRFYKRLISTADARYSQHLNALQKEEQISVAANARPKKGKKR